MDDDKKYLKYWDEDIDQEEFLRAAYEGLNDYLNTRKYSYSSGKNARRQQEVRDAFEDMVNRGITGYSKNATNIANMEGLDLSKYGAFNPYGEASTYIGQQMKRLSKGNSQKKEEEKKKTKFTNEYMVDSFHTSLSNTNFGGQTGALNTLWNSRDELVNGVRGITNRKNLLIAELQNWGNKINEQADTFDFEGTPFTDINDFNARRQAAITALQNSGDTITPEARTALQQLGLNSDLYFNNGANEASGYSDSEGNPLTNAQYQEYLSNQQKLKAQQEAQKQAAIKANYYTNYRYFGSKMNGITPTGSDALKRLNTYATKGNLSAQEQSELVGAFKFAARNGGLQTLSKEELAKFGPMWQGRTRNLRKINGLNGFYWDIVGKRVVQPYNQSSVPTVNFQDLVNQNSPEALKQKQLTTPRGKGIQLTDADKRDITATIADVVALIDPEIISGTAAALTASGLRTYNSVQERGIWDTITDWKTWADWGTGALGGTPLLGDASSLAKVARAVGKWMTIPALVSAFNSVPEAKQAWDKIDFNNLTESVKKLTPQDFHALFNVLVGVLGGKNYIKGNLAERKVLQESGINTQAKTKRREYANKFGLTRTKAAESTEIPTIKAKVGNDDVEIRLTKEQQSRIQEKVKRAGNSEEARNKAIKEELKGKEHTTTDGKKVKIDDNTTVSVRAPKSILDRSWMPSSVGTSGELFGTTTISSTRGADNFENWLNSRSTWDQYKPWSLGTNSDLRLIYNNKGLGTIVQDQQNNSTQSTTNSQTETSNTKALPLHTNKKVDIERIKKYQENLKEEKVLIHLMTQFLMLKVIQEQ